MLYYMATADRSDEFQPKIVKFLKVLLGGYNIRIIVSPRHIVESKLPKFTEADLLLWHPRVAGENLELVREHNSLVVLASRTIYVQKVSGRNPINENLAVNNNFRLLYIDENFSDITNADWKLAVQEDDYRVTHKQLISNIEQNGYGQKKKGIPADL
jgi:hypothetical protein